MSGDFNLFAKFQQVLGGLARFVAIEQGLALVIIADDIGCRIKAEGQFLRILAQFSEQKRIAARIGGHIDRIAGQFALFTQKDIYTLVQTHQRQRHGITA